MQGRNEFNTGAQVNMGGMGGLGMGMGGMGGVGYQGW